MDTLENAILIPPTTNDKTHNLDTRTPNHESKGTEVLSSHTGTILSSSISNQTKETNPASKITHPTYDTNDY